ASSGMPTPANTTCPSLRWRALRTASSSVEVNFGALSIVNALSCPRGLEQIRDPDKLEKSFPGFWSIDVAFEIALRAFNRIAIDEIDVFVEVAHHRLVDAVASVRRAAEWQFDNRVDREERNLGLVGRAADLVVRHDALCGQDHLVGRQSEINVHKLQTIDLGIAEGVASLNVN